MNIGQMNARSTAQGIPVYRRIATELWSEVQSGALPAGQKLPNETELAARFGVTRLTLRQAVTELQRLGAVEIRRGVGTFVVTPPDLVEVVASVPSAPQSADALAQALDGLPHDEHALTGHALTGQALDGEPPRRQTGVEPRQQRSVPPLRSVDEVVLSSGPANDALGAAAAEHLGAPQQDLVRLDTVMLRDGRRWIANTYWYRAGLAPIPELLERHSSVVAALTAGAGVTLRYLWRAFSAVAADFEDAARLDVPPGTALLVRDGVSAGADGQPVFYVRRRLRGDEARFVLRYDTDTASGSEVTDRPDAAAAGGVRAAG